MPMPTVAEQQAYQRAWVRQNRLDWLMANGPCRRCGSWNYMEVDHVEPSTKVAHNVWSWSRERREAELAKCQVLCRDCHRAKTAADYRRGAIPAPTPPPPRARRRTERRAKRAHAVHVPGICSGCSIPFRPRFKWMAYCETCGRSRAKSTRTAPEGAGCRK